MKRCLVFAALLIGRVVGWFGRRGVTLTVGFMALRGISVRMKQL